MGTSLGSLLPNAASWGGFALTLQLPALNIKFTGLSSAQHQSLSHTYCNFLAQQPCSNEIECKVYRLETAPDIDPKDITSDNQYTPLKIRDDATDSVDVIGINFKAQFSFNVSARSSLGVAKEQELAHANVIENYLRIVSAHKVLTLKGVVLHSAGLVFEEKAYIFSGRSNAGKTTLTRKAYAIGARVLSDDINLVLPGENGYNAYAVPFTGEFGRTLSHAGGKDAYPLAGIILLEQSDQLQTKPVRNSLAVARLLSGCPFVNTDEHESDALFDSVCALVQEVPVIRLLNQRTDTIEEIMAAVRNQFSKPNNSEL